MAGDRSIAQAQKGITLADALAAAKARAGSKSKGQGAAALAAMIGGHAGAANGHAGAGHGHLAFGAAPAAVAERPAVGALGDDAPADAAADGTDLPGGSQAAAITLDGPFLSPGSLTREERIGLIDAIAGLLEGLYTHLPLKRARYGVDPIQRLRILRTQTDELTDDQFHYELADIVTGLRDAHTRYVGPISLRGKVAVLPFLVERAGKPNESKYLVTHVAPTAGLDASFKPGVTIKYWNGVPIDRAVELHAAQEVGGRPDTQRAWATQSLTARSLRFSPPPDEYWVRVGYVTPENPNDLKEIKIDWRVVNTLAAPPSGNAAPVGAVPARAAAPLREASRLMAAPGQQRAALAVNPAAEEIRQAKMLLFAPHVLTGQKPTRARRKAQTAAATGAALAAAPMITPIQSNLPETLEAKRIEVDGEAFGYLRIWAFDTEPAPFINEVIRLLAELPDRGLIVDIRGNPGGYIFSSEVALQLFSPRPIQPTRFSALATPFSRAMAGLDDSDLAPWKPSLEAAVRNGELYSQALPISPPDICNVIGQQYGGPAVLVGDATSYSAADLFSAGWVDNKVGTFICVGSATGAGGANVFGYGDLRTVLAGTKLALPELADGIELSFSFRRATRSGPSEGLPIEDVGVAGDEAYAMTADDLLQGNRDLIAHCIDVLKREAFSRFAITGFDEANRTITVSTVGLDRVDVLFDGHPGSTNPVGAANQVTVQFPAGTKRIDFTGFFGDEVRQRRRIDF